MKRIFAIAVVLLLLAVPSFAFQNWSTGSGEKTDATLQVYTVSGSRAAVTSLAIMTNGSTNVTVILYDGTSASDPVIWECTVVGSDNYGGRNWTFPREVSKGIYATLSGAGGSYIVEYIKR